MKAKTHLQTLGLAVFLMTGMSVTVNAQFWGSSTIPTIASNGGVLIEAASGTECGASTALLPQMALNIVDATYATVSSSHNIFEIDHSILNCTYASSSRPIFFVGTSDLSGASSMVGGGGTPNYQAFVGINKPTAASTLDVGGTINADANLTVGQNATIAGTLYVQADLIDMTDVSDIWRNINANSNVSGLIMNAGPSGANIALNAQGATDGGSININTTGSGTGVNFNSSSLTPTMNISNAGNVTIANNNTVGGNLIVNQNATINQNSNIVGNLNVNGIAVIGTPSTAPSILATPSPGSEYSLYVANGILTEKVKVALHSDFNWADFVFNKDYKLKPLNEVEKYVKANKHLPEVPSANEVAEDGIDVANMDSKLLQKIEELTLYVIEQQKQLEQQKNEIDQLKKKMD